MDSLREGAYDVLVGVNLLREGLDFPEVSLVAILDADKEGFLRSHRSLTQTAGRAARNVHGLVIFYADSITDSMQAVSYTHLQQALHNNMRRTLLLLTLLLSSLLTLSAQTYICLLYTSGRQRVHRVICYRLPSTAESTAQRATRAAACVTARDR